MQEIRLGGKRYGFTDDALKHIHNMAASSHFSHLEQGATLESADGETVARLGRVCTGDECSVKISRVASPLVPVGDVHSHPHSSSAPSWGDVYYLLWNRIFGGRDNIVCQVGTYPDRAGEALVMPYMQCERVQRNVSWADKEMVDFMRERGNEWNEKKHQWGASTFPRYYALTEQTTVPWPTEVADAQDKAEVLCEQIQQRNETRAGMLDARILEPLRHGAEQSDVNQVCHNIAQEQEAAARDADRAYAAKTDSPYQKCPGAENAASMIADGLSTLQRTYCLSFERQRGRTVVDCDVRYTLNELRDMARAHNLSTSGDKKALCRKLIDAGAV